MKYWPVMGKRAPVSFTLCTQLAWFSTVELWLPAQHYRTCSSLLSLPLTTYRATYSQTRGVYVFECDRKLKHALTTGCRGRQPKFHDSRAPVQPGAQCHIHCFYLGPETELEAQSEVLENAKRRTTGQNCPRQIGVASLFTSSFIVTAIDDHHPIRSVFKSSRIGFR